MKSWRSIDTYGVGGVAHLERLLRLVIPGQGEIGNPLSLQPPLGANFIFNNPENTNVGLDGYDNEQAPKDENGNFYRRRMWVSGKLDFLRPIHTNDVVECNDRVSLVRRIGDSVFVQIDKQYSVGEGLALKELRSLVYTNKPFSEKADLTETGNPDGAEVTFSALDVRKFCSLSYNLHKIHHSKAHCLAEGFPEIVVPGPLLTQTMLRVLQLNTDVQDLRLFSYKMSSPCYVGEPLVVRLAKNNRALEIWGRGRIRALGVAHFAS